LGIPILFVTVGFELYADTDVAWQPYAIGLFLPLSTVLFHVVARLWAYRLMSRITEAVGYEAVPGGGAGADMVAGADAVSLGGVRVDDIPVVSDAHVWPIGFLLQFLLALAGRVMISTAAASQAGVAIASALVGLTELLGRVSVEARDALGHRLCCCSRPLPSSSRFFSDPEKVRFLCDHSIAATMASFSACLIAPLYVVFDTLIHGNDAEAHRTGLFGGGDSAGALAYDYLQRAGIQVSELDAAASTPTPPLSSLSCSLSLCLCLSRCD
jgi:hypothetical protein